LANILLNDFSIQKTEVTNFQYRICRQAGGCRSDPAIVKDYAPQENGDLPVVNLTALQAREFCLWLGGDLPTSEQWERAARGLNGRNWPWGDADPSLDLANIKPTGIPGARPTITPTLRAAGTLTPQPTGTPNTVKVTSFWNGRAPEGILNLVGNVREWTRTQYFQGINPSLDSFAAWNGIDSDINVRLIERGGSFKSFISRITEVQQASPTNINDDLGFRCVKP
jgi:iron(II)-dependent oxidoreductase